MLKYSLLLISVLTILLGCEGKPTPKIDEKKSNSKPTIKTKNSKPEVIHGHTLPPEPDEALNNSTLLGIDTNHNGVRDDVERWIYHKYKDMHIIHVEIAMQKARANKLVLDNPSNAKAIHREVGAALYCEAYYQIYAKYFNKPLLVKEDIVTKRFRKLIFNTPARKKAYHEYDTLLSGDSYTTPKIGEGKNFCDFDISKYEE